MITSVDQLRAYCATIVTLLQNERAIERNLGAIVDAGAEYLAEPFGAASIGATTKLAAALNPYAGRHDRVGSYTRQVLDFISRKTRKSIGTAVIAGRGVVPIYDVVIIEATVVDVGAGRQDKMRVSIKFALIGDAGVEVKYGESVREFERDWLGKATAGRLGTDALRDWLDACRNEVILAELGDRLGELAEPAWSATPPTVAGYYFMARRDRDADGNYTPWSIQLVELAAGKGEALEFQMFDYLGTDRVHRQDRDLTRWLGPIEAPAPPAEGDQ